MSNVEVQKPAGGRRTSGKFGMVTRIAMLICVLAAVVYAGNAWMGMRSSRADQAASENTVVRAMGLIEPTEKHLSSEFTDSTGSLLADPPKDPAQFIEPRTIVLAHLADSEEAQSMNWPDVEKHITQVTGLPVEDEIFDNGPAQLDEIKAGKITLVALHAADAPFLVNNYGYEPIAVMGNEGGAAGNKLDLIVPENSSLSRPADLKAQPNSTPHNLTCSVPSSITGYRAAVTLLLENEQLRPNVDYFVTWSMKMKDSIKGIADGKYEMAAISDDKLQSMLEKGTVKQDSYRIIYSSDVIPRTTIGSFYNLKPDLAGKIREAILSFKPTGAETEDGDKPMRLLPVDYKKDFALVRKIDDQFDPRLDTKQKTKKVATATTNP
jgi:phosphonate transport system substrate-binding protein